MADNFGQILIVGRQSNQSISDFTYATGGNFVSSNDQLIVIGVELKAIVDSRCRTVVLDQAVSGHSTHSAVTHDRENRSVIGKDIILIHRSGQCQDIGRECLFSVNGSEGLMTVLIRCAQSGIYGEFVTEFEFLSIGLTIEAIDGDGSSLRSGLGGSFCGYRSLGGSLSGLGSFSRSLSGLGSFSRSLGRLGSFGRSLSLTLGRLRRLRPIEGRVESEVRVNNDKSVDDSGQILIRACQRYYFISDVCFAGIGDLIVGLDQDIIIIVEGEASVRRDRCIVEDRAASRIMIFVIVCQIGMMAARHGSVLGDREYILEIENTVIHSILIEQLYYGIGIKLSCVERTDFTLIDLRSVQCGVYIEVIINIELLGLNLAVQTADMDDRLIACGGRSYGRSLSGLGSFCRSLSGSNSRLVRMGTINQFKGASVCRTGLTVIKDITNLDILYGYTINKIGKS